MKVLAAGAMLLLLVAVPVVRHSELAQVTPSHLAMPASISDRKHMLAYLKTQVWTPPPSNPPRPGFLDPRPCLSHAAVRRAVMKPTWHCIHRHA